MEVEVKHQTWVVIDLVYRKYRRNRFWATCNTLVT